MNGRMFTVGTPTNPFLQALHLLLGGLVVIGAVLMGAVILAIALGFIFIFGAVFWIRLWWLRRKMLRAGLQSGSGSEPLRPGSGRVIEVEYTVVDQDAPRDRED